MQTHYEITERKKAYSRRWPVDSSLVCLCVHANVIRTRYLWSCGIWSFHR